MKNLKFFTLLLLLWLPQLSFADNNINLSQEMISSAERCAIDRAPTKSSVLSCKTYFQSTNYTCGPAAVMTLMHYYNMLSSAEMNHNTELRIANEMGATPGQEGGTTISQVADWLSSHGFNVDSGQGVDSTTLIANIKKGIPTFVAYERHWILAKGYNEGSATTYQNKPEIIFSDSCCGTKVLPVDTIDSMWDEAHIHPKMCGANTGGYIVATPRR